MAIWVLGILLLVVVGGGNKDGVTASSGGSGSSCGFPAVYGFGDDNSDTGGNAAAFDNLVYPMARLSSASLLADTVMAVSLLIS